MIKKTVRTHALTQTAALMVLLGAVTTTQALAQTATPPVTAAAEAAAAPTAPWVNGEITRWDARTLRITLRHGEIQNLEMPPMTMAFRVQDASVVGTLQPGDKVRFQAQKINSSYHVTQVEKAP
ncbi:MAG: copper-binding protein [Burkholderiaceae bacterium]|nr:copper-binding protein [Burkholderiaceae bacterium]